MEMTFNFLYFVLFVVLATSASAAGGGGGPVAPGSGAGGEVRAEVGGAVSLPCRVDTAQCGELHSVKWYRDTQRIYVFSPVGRPEGLGSDRMTVEYTPNSSISHLHIKQVELTDEALYKCEKTYLEVRENCDVVQVIKLRTLVRPQSVRILSRDGSALGNATKLGPLNEDTDVELECEAAGAKPVPQVTWFNGTTRMNGVYSSEEGPHGMGNARSKLRLTLQRGDLFAEYRCVVESDALLEPIVSWLTADVHVRPTKLELTGVKSHVVQGTNVVLRCNVFGARPAANITWYNGTDPISPDMIETSPVLTEDGTFITQSELVFAASRYENGQTLICEAENKVLREQMERPLQQKLTLEVLYPPIVTVSPENITVNESQDILFLCSYVANPALLDSVKWYKGDQIITLNEEHYEGGTIENPPLLIKNVSREDTGEYSCALENSIGLQESWNMAALNVLFKPVVELKMEPSNIVKSLDRINVTLLCNVVAGNPDTLLRVQWFLGGRMLKELWEENCTNDVNSDRTFCDLDPSRMLLEYVTEKFAGNYSCRAMNEAGWGLISNETELIVYYPPSQALVRYEPTRVLKKSTVTLYCAVEEPGRPADTQYMWLRGGHVVHNATNPKWTIQTVTFEADSNFTCIAYNEGGQGPSGTVNIEVLAPPAFIVPLQPYTGALMNAKNISISCRIECSPMCTVSWLKNGKPLENNNLYSINETRYPPDLRTYDFESIQSVLNWKMSAWPNQQLNRIQDNANYTCQSSKNDVGPGVTSTTLFAVEYPPENISVSNRVVSVIENHIPERVICSAKAHPEVSYTWHREPHPEIISKGNALMLGAVTRTAAGNYICRAFNRHGNDTHKVFLNVLYKPECAITQTERNGNPALVCTAHANPKEMTFTWKVKGMNETPDDMRSIEQDGIHSFLILDSGVDTLRTYQCYANNSIGFSGPCERDVAGTIAWWKRIDQDNLLIIIAIIVGIIVCVIIVCIIIIIVCRRKRANNKYNNPVELEEREKPDGQSPDSTSQSKWPLKPGVLVHVNRMHNLNMRNFSQLSLSRSSEMKATRVFPKAGRRYRHFGNRKSTSRWLRLKEFFGFGDQDVLPIGVYHGASGVVTFKKINTSTPIRVDPTTISRKRKKPGQGPNPSNTADKNGNPAGNATDPLADPENKTFYENLPFHGMQNPPNKPVSIITPFVQENALQNSMSNLNMSTKSLVQFPTNPLASPTVQQTNKVQRNQSFHGFQSAYRMPQPNAVTNQNFLNQTGHTSSLFSQNMPSVNKSSYGLSNLIYSSNQMPSRSAIGPLILSPNTSRVPPNTARSRNPFIMHPGLPYPVRMPVRAQQFMSYPVPVVVSPRSQLSKVASTRTIAQNMNARNTLHVSNISRHAAVVREQPPDKSNLKSASVPLVKTENDAIKTNEISAPKQTVMPQKHARRCARKFDSFEHRKHNCNSPMFYSVRCRKHGKKKTVFELYALPVKQKSNKVSASADSAADAPRADTETNCVVISQIPAHQKENDDQNLVTDEALYQNLTDSIQILEQNRENSASEILNCNPKPAPRCRKSTNNIIYQNIAFFLKVTPEKNPNDGVASDNDKTHTDTNVSENKPSPENNCAESNLSISKETCENLKTDVESKSNNVASDEPTKVTDDTKDDVIDSSMCNVPKEVKADLESISGLKRPIPIKPKDISNPVLVPKMPLLDMNNKWTKQINAKNPFYTLTAPQLTSSHPFSNEQLYSSTFPHQRHTRLAPRALFPDQQISKSKSFSSRNKQKKHFQIPLQKCHSFKFQTAESYFQPIKNIHEENLMRNGYQSDYGPNYSRDSGHVKRDRHKANVRQMPAILRRSSDAQKYRENVQFHENIQNSVQLQYPQPLYAHNSGCAVKKNGVVYADLDINSKSDKRNDEFKRTQNKSKTEYATLKFNDVGQEIDV